jgi:hypothetical protein
VRPFPLLPASIDACHGSHCKCEFAGTVRDFQNPRGYQRLSKVIERKENLASSHAQHRRFKGRYTISANP